ncbi:hypothetical protein DAPPUDRAFT_235902 [Daphnia pulex]|uniref:Uncharacterized protein n=1 Tax=Daphnia pulex TaxID=6669 RepID=E9FZC8_DAPPU|nr:hypothetical protein DAPPUDRAFT_235902 [Daphnia pulex]|eukprot:EFX87286.1 hypothetical protein DAPPUDRAFT_235902 [Daphnia pulex]
MKMSDMGVCSQYSVLSSHLSGVQQFKILCHFYLPVTQKMLNEVGPWQQERPV